MSAEGDGVRARVIGVRAAAGGSGWEVTYRLEGGETDATWRVAAVETAAAALERATTEMARWGVRLDAEGWQG